MRRRTFIRSLGAAGALEAVLPSFSASSATLQTVATRQQWVSVATKVADPVLRSLADDRLKQEMPVEVRTATLRSSREKFTHLEAFGRLLSGLAPWLDLPADETEEGRLRSAYAVLVHRSLANAVHPATRDTMNFAEGSQPLVDASFLALGLLRGPSIWNAVDAATKRNVIEALRKTRTIKPGFNNWLLFSALIESFFLSIGEQYDRMRIDYALRQHDQWYKGDGVYGDGPDFHWDYYNSFVIQPYMRAILPILVKADPGYAVLSEKFNKIAMRYALVQERLIGRDGTYPAIGRSLAYRCGAFHHLANETLLKRLPADLPAAQVRSALGAVIQATLGPKETFDQHGWLTLGLSGHQPGLAEDYISTGSLYLCATAFLPLGLSATDEFWTAAPVPWTSMNAWGGSDLKADGALKL